MKFGIRNSSQSDSEGKFEIEGDLTIYSVAKIKEQLLGQLRRSPAVEVDLSRVTNLDTAGFQLLLYMHKRALSMDKRFAITGTSQVVESVLGLYNTRFN